MQQTLNLLLNEIENESSKVHQTFRYTGVHSDLEDFSIAIDAFEKLDKILKPNGDFSDTEAKIIGTYYSVLAFRIVDASLRYDELKFNKAKSILERAEEITIGGEPVVHQAKAHLQRKLSQLYPSKIERAFSHADKYLHSLERFMYNEYINLIFDFRAQSRLRYFLHNFKKYSHDGLLNGFKRGAKLFGSMFYDSARTLTVLYCGLSGVSDIAKGDYKSGIIKSVIAIGIPLSRYVYRRRKTEEMLGFNYQIPELKYVSRANV
ncbi:hypothetical protein HY636_05470 [Candidatus Woesearchaeota archaeon]|nr:hypothetical protein [Candidatus Woesearchaeota archaeon]